jgi:hypothetical protein
MPFNRVLFDNESWYISTGMLGIGINIYHKNQGITRKATRYEQLFLFEVLEYMKGRGVPVDSGCPEIEAIYETFARTFFVQGQPAREGLFLTTAPKDWAVSVLAAR